MSREIIDSNELNKWLTDELQKVEDCQGSILTFQYRLQTPDENGCNWSGAVVQPGPMTSAASISVAANEIVAMARSVFNLSS
jgi:hypothetical protein